MAAAAAVSVSVATDLGFAAADASKLVTAFQAVDKDGSGNIDDHEVKELLASVGVEATAADVDALIASADHDADGKVSFSEFAKMYAGKKDVALRSAVTKKHGGLARVAGAVGHHSYSEEEKRAFAAHFNSTLAGDEYLKAQGVIPMNVEDDSLFTALGDGIVLIKFLNAIKADTVDERAVNFAKAGKPLNVYKKNENLAMALASARALGCHVVNVGATDLLRTVEDSKQYLALGLIWQAVKMHLLSAINLKERPELVKLLEDDEEIADLMALPAEDVLLRWLNYHCAKEGLDRRVTNFGGDLKDSVVYAHVLHSIDASSADDKAILGKEGRDRAAAVIEAATAQGVDAFIQPGDITTGNKRLNLGFCAQIFNNNPGLVEDEAELAKLVEAAGLEEEDGDDREERVFKSIANGMDLSRFINNLVYDLSDGLLLLEIIDKVQPGLVDWKKCNKPREGRKLHRIKAVANCNYAVDLCKGPLALSVVGIGGVDIADKNRKLTLAIVWQLMRKRVLSLLQEAGGGKAPSDAELVSWANKTVAATGKESKVSSMRDSSLATGLFLLDLLNAIQPGIVSDEIVTPGGDDAERKNNARYVVSVARKIGAQVFCTWEDVVEVKPKMIFTLLAAIKLAQEQAKVVA